MQISSKKRSLCIKYALHVFTASTIYSLSFPMLLAVITHYHLRPSMNKARSFPTIHLYDLIYAETSIYASSGFGHLGPKPCGGDYYYYYLRIFTEDKHFSIIHTVINMCPPDPITYILYIHKILTNCKIR